MNLVERDRAVLEKQREAMLQDVQHKMYTTASLLFSACRCSLTCGVLFVLSSAAVSVLICFLLLLLHASLVASRVRLMFEGACGVILVILIFEFWCLFSVFVLF